MKTTFLLVLMVFGCSPVMADLHTEPNYLEVEGPAVMKCIKTINHLGKVTYWAKGKDDADGNETFDLVRPPARFSLVEDLGEVEIEEVLSNGKNVTYQVHDYGGICSFD